ncbi:hypothetical protein CsatB_017648 [Cannabis sativa]
MIRLLIAPLKAHETLPQSADFLADVFTSCLTTPIKMALRCAAAKNWAHFAHIHFGLMPNQTGKKTNVCQQEGEDVLMKDGFFASANQVGVSPY